MGVRFEFLKLLTNNSKLFAGFASHTYNDFAAIAYMMGYPIAQGDVIAYCACTSQYKYSWIMCTVYLSPSFREAHNTPHVL